MRTLPLVTLAVIAAACGGTIIEQSPPPTLRLVFGPFSGSSLAIAPGSTMQITARVISSSGETVPPDAPPTFTSDNPTVISITPDGLLTALAVGSARIAAQARVGAQAVSGSFPVGTVCTLELRWVLNPTEQTLAVGERFTPQARLTSCQGYVTVEERFVWSTSDPAILAVDPNSGATIALQPGTGFVVVTSGRYSNVQAAIRVTVE